MKITNTVFFEDGVLYFNDRCSATFVAEAEKGIKNSTNFWEDFLYYKEVNPGRVEVILLNNGCRMIARKTADGSSIYFKVYDPLAGLIFEYRHDIED